MGQLASVLPGRVGSWSSAPSAAVVDLGGTAASKRSSTAPSPTTRRTFSPLAARISSIFLRKREVLRRFWAVLRLGPSRAPQAKLECVGPVLVWHQGHSVKRCSAPSLTVRHPSLNTAPHCSPQGGKADAVGPEPQTTLAHTLPNLVQPASLREDRKVHARTPAPQQVLRKERLVG